MGSRWRRTARTPCSRRSASSPRGDAFNAISLQPQSGAPFNPLINAGAIAACGLIPGDTVSRRLRAHPRHVFALRRPRARHRRTGLRLRERDRPSQSRDRLDAAQLLDPRRRPDDHARDLLPAMRDPRHLPRSRADGRDAWPTAASIPSPASARSRGVRGQRPVGDGDLRHVRFLGRMAVPDRLAGEERRRRRHPRRPARAHRHRRLLAAARRAGQQRARHRRVPRTGRPTSGCTCSTRRSARCRRMRLATTRRSVASKRRRSSEAAEHLRSVGHRLRLYHLQGALAFASVEPRRARTDGPRGGHRILHRQPGRRAAHRRRCRAPARANPRRAAAPRQDAGLRRGRRVVATC